MKACMRNNQSNLSSGNSEIIVQKTCTIQKKYPTLIPKTYTAYHLTTYVVVEHVFCWFFPTFSCPRQVEKTRTISSLKTKLIESTITRTLSVCCPGYVEVPGRENACTPVCEEECENGGICRKPDECICKPQYRGVTCGEDVDECSSSGICEHNCTNLFGSYQCTCPDGFYLGTDESSCDEYTLRINSFKATLKSADSVSLDWQLETEPFMEDVSELISSISIIRVGGTTLPNLSKSSRSVLFFDLQSNASYTYHLSIVTIHGDAHTATLTIETPDRDIQCPDYYNTHYTNPCPEGAICRDSLDPPNYACECLPGYAGPDCLNINECRDEPCQNGAHCVDGIDEYTCICSSQRFTGENCEIQRSTCDLDGSPCNGHGTCNAGTDNYTCDCETGYRGVRCEEEIDFCSSNPCQNGGTCMNEDYDAVCQCTPNYSGEFCELIIDPCFGHSCNGGQCFVTQNKEPICNCSDHLTGDRCNITCRDDNGDLCSCDTTTQDGQCREHCLEDGDHFYNITWNQTIRGSTATVPCSTISSTLKGSVSRNCLSTSRWSDVNVTDCRELSDTGTPDKFKNCTTARSVAEDLLTYTDVLGTLPANSSNIETLFSLLKELSAYTNRESCPDDLQTNLLAILSELLESRFISTLLMDDKIEFRDTLTKIEDIITHLLPTYNVTLQDTGKSRIPTDGGNIDFISIKLPKQATDEMNYEIEFLSGDEKRDVSLSIPSQILQDNGVTPRVDVLIIQSSDVFNSPNPALENAGELISRIISVNIRNKDQQFEGLEVPIQISFDITANDFDEVSCVYLNRLGEWSPEGITLQTISNNSVTCNTYHLSMFAILQRSAVPTTQFSTPPPTPDNTTQQNDSSVINILTLISSLLASSLLVIFLLILCITRIFTSNNTSNFGRKVNTVCMVNTSSAHLFTCLLIALTVTMQLIAGTEPVLCFASRAVALYGYFVTINSILAELIIGLLYIRFADKDGQLKRLNWLLAVSIILCWAAPAVITLFTTIPLYNTISELQSTNPLLCLFLSIDEALYLIAAYFGISFAIFISLSLIALVYGRQTGITRRNKTFFMRFIPRPTILLLSHLLLYLIIIVAVFVVEEEIKTHMFYFHQILVVILLLALLCYMERRSFRVWFKVKEELRNEDTEASTGPPPREIQYILVGDDNRSRIEFPTVTSPCPCTMTETRDSFFSPTCLNHSRFFSDSILLEDDRSHQPSPALSERRSKIPTVPSNDHSETQEQLSAPQRRQTYALHRTTEQSQTFPRYMMPCTLPPQSTLQYSFEKDPRFCPSAHGRTQPKLSDFSTSHNIRLKHHNAMSCDLLHTPEPARRAIVIPVTYVEKRTLNRHTSNSLPFLHLVSMEDQ